MSGITFTLAILTWIGGKVTDFHKEHQAFEQNRFETAKTLCMGELRDCSLLKTYYPKFIGPEEPAK